MICMDSLVDHGCKRSLILIWANVDIIRSITCHLTGSELFKLFATGDTAITNKLTNGVDRICFVNKFTTHDTIGLTVSRDVKHPHPSFWFKFKYIKFIDLLDLIPFRVYNNNTTTSFVPQHLFSSLNSLSLKVLYKDSNLLWTHLMHVANEFHNLETLKFITADDLDFAIPDKRLTFQIPENLTSTLRNLHLKIDFIFWFKALPPDLKTLIARGDIADFDVVHSSVHNQTAQVSTSGVIQRRVRFDDEQSLIQQSFPQDLISLEFELRRRGSVRSRFKFDLFCSSLPAKLLSLKFYSALFDYDVSVKHCFAHLLPRGLEYMDISTGIHDMPVSISHLPQNLKHWYGTHQPRVIDETECVYLPPSLQILSFTFGFNASLWPSVSYEACNNLLIGNMNFVNSNVVLLESDKICSRIGSLKNIIIVPLRHASITRDSPGMRDISRLAPNCETVSVNLRCINHHKTISVIAETLPIRLTRLSITISMLHSIKFDTTTRFFSVLPKTMEDLTVEYTCGPASLETLLCSDDEADFARNLPILTSLTISHEPDLTLVTSENAVEPAFNLKSLPKTLQSIELCGISFEIYELFSILPSGLEVFESQRCNITDYRMIKWFMRSHVGSSTPRGLTINIILNKESLSGIHPLLTLCDLSKIIRSRNDHLRFMGLFWSVSSRLEYEIYQYCFDVNDDEKPAKLSYYKRIERE